MSQPAIQVKNVSKAFVLPHERSTSVKSLLINSFRHGRSFERQQVLKDISFEIAQGEFFGIVGRNGGGKSTLLKLLAGIYTPDAGSVTLHGKLTPFIELGVGFNPELTGRENVYLNGALLGFSRRETESMYKGIVEFAELEAFMDQKLKNYSSGMQVRLAFSIAIRAQSDILLLDEVLAVGDEAFQRKCLDVFEQYKANKQTVILVTHDMTTVRRFCSRAMLINEGRIVEIGNPRAVADKYSELNQKAIDKEVARDNAAAKEPEPEKIHYLKAVIRDAAGRAKTGFAFGDRLTVDLSWSGLPSDRIESIGVHMFKLSGEHLTGINSRTGNLAKNWRDQGRLGLEFKLDIQPGKYYFVIELFEHAGQAIDSITTGLQFGIGPHVMEWSGLIELPHTWHEPAGSK